MTEQRIPGRYVISCANLVDFILLILQRLQIKLDRAINDVKIKALFLNI